MKQFNNVISQDAVYNILGHLKKCWDYTYPTGKALEEAFYRGIKPFYTDVKSLGSPKTIVDVAKGTDAFDIKGSKKLGHLKRLSKKSNFENNFIIDVNVPLKGSIKVRIPKSVHTQVRRPKVDLKGYQGNSSAILTEQINEYANFALKTSTEEGCTEIYSVVCQYGIEKGFKSVFLNITKFTSTPITTASTRMKTDKTTPAAYEGFDDKGNLSFALSSFNRGSSNLTKTFQTDFGILYTWPEEEEDPTIYKLSDLQEAGAVSIIK